MSVEIETLVSEIEGGCQTSETLERQIAQVAGVVATRSRRPFLSDLDEAVELPGRRGWNFALSSGKYGGQRYFGACIFKPNSEHEVLAQRTGLAPGGSGRAGFPQGCG